MSGEEQFLSAAMACVDSFLTLLSGSTIPKPKVVLIHHNDTDGLTSGAILSTAIREREISLDSIALEKPYPLVVNRLFDHNDAKTILIFADFASGMIQKIIEANRRKNPVFILDHHAIEPATRPPWLRLLNPLDFGVPGNTACSASTVAFHFAGQLLLQQKALLSLIPRLAVVGVLGAIGDAHTDSSGKVTGLNFRAQAATEDLLTFRNGEFFVQPPQSDAYSLGQLKEWIDVCGSLNYFEAGCTKVLSALASYIRGTPDPFAPLRVEGTRVVAEFQAGFDAFVHSNPLIRSSRLQYFFVPPAFERTGVKTVGLLCEALIREGIADENRYLLGFQRVPTEIPTLGALMPPLTKISMRLPPALRRLVNEGKAKDLVAVLPPATRQVGGFVDACHPQAAATVINAGREKDLLVALERLL